MMGLSRRIVASVTLLAATPALAQPTAQQKQAAGDLTRQAITRSNAGDHDKAVELYLQAYAIVPLPVLLTNVATEYQKSKKPVEALKYFCMYLKEDPAGQNVSYATAQAKSIQIEQGNKDVTDETVCEPAKPKEPEPVAVQPPPVEPPKASTDGGGGLRIAGLGLGAAGLVGLGVGIYFGFKAKDISDEITNHPMNEEWPEDIQDLEDRGAAHEKKQIIFMIAGGAVLATGVALYFIGRSKKSGAERVTLVPTATPEAAGIAFTGGF